MGRSWQRRWCNAGSPGRSEKRSGKKGKGRGGGGGRGVRGVDFGMMARFKSSFVAASPSSQNQTTSNSNIVSNRPALSGFVAGGSIGGDAHRPQPTTTTNSAPASGGSIAGQSSDQKNNER
ncbi:DEAD-box ATP-dependent RNA helicase 24 [Bienertia sinuspersici]